MGYRLDIIALLPILLTTGVVLTVPVYNVIINGAWSEWTNISQCYARSCNNSCGKEKKTCEKGEMVQIRFCNNPAPGYRGRWCRGPILRKVECENHVRPGWSEWGPVACAKDCRSSEDVTVTGYRSRTCNNPPPIHNADMCCGIATESQDENPNICKDLPICFVSTTTTTSTTKVTCPTTEGYDYSDGDQPKLPIKKDDISYDYSECS